MEALSSREDQPVAADKPTFEVLGGDRQCGQLEEHRFPTVKRQV